jgi:biopolymer transport protein ExbB
MNSLDHALATWSAGGWLLLSLALVSVLIFAFIFRTTFSIGFLMKSVETFRAGLENCGGNGPRVEIFLKKQTDELGRRYAQTLTMKGSISQGLEEIENVLLSVQSRDRIILSALTASAPLLGLLGTVIGMIATFQATATMDGDTGQQIADGISSALITTQFGLVIALPGVFGSAYLFKRIRELETRLTQCRFLILEALGL